MTNDTTQNMSASGSARCPVEITVALIGGKWKPYVLFNLAGGSKRYSDLKRCIPNVSDRMFSRALRELESDELVKVFRDCGLTRLPVFDGTLDTPIGFVNLKDFALKHGFSKTKGGYELQALVRPLLYVPPSMQLGILLQKMQTERTHMALVIDEYGGTDGLVTIEDLIEQVVGAIEDEHDHEEVKSWVREAPGVYLARAKTGLDDFEAEIGMALTAHDEIDEEDVDTLGGLVFMLSGHVPVRGEVIQHPDGVEFEVLDADPRKIKRLRVRLPQSKDA